MVCALVRMLGRAAGRLAAVVLVVVSVVAFAPNVAQAAPADLAGTSSCVPKGGGVNVKDASGHALLPMDRWSDATTSLHSRLGASWTDDFWQKMNRNVIQGGSMVAVDLSYAGTRLTSGIAARSNPVCAAAPEIDGASARVTDSLFGPGMVMIVAILVFGTFKLLRAASRNPEATGRILIKGFAQMIGFGTLALLTAQAGGQTTRAPDGTVILGEFSPSWWAQVTSNSLAAVSDAPMCALQQLAGTTVCGGVAASTAAPTSGTGLNCRAYQDALTAEFIAKAGDSPEARSALMLNSMWEGTQLQAFNFVQFGAASDVGSEIGCFILEVGSNVPGRTITERIGSFGDVKALPSGIFNIGTSKEIDRLGVQLAVCRWDGDGWVSSPTMVAVFNPDGFTRPSTDSPDGSGTKFGEAAPKVCDAWARFKDFHPDTGYLWSEVMDSPTLVKQLTDNSPMGQNFLLSWHGDSTSASLLMLAAAAGAIAIAVTVGLLSLAVILSKFTVAALITLIGLFAVMSMWPSERSERFVKFAKFIVGLLAFGLVTQLVMGLITGFSAIGTALMKGAFEAGSPELLLVTGLMPAAALMMVTVVFRAAGIHSPFRLTAAFGWATAFAGAGAGLGLAASGAMSRGRQVARAGASRVMGRSGGAGAGLGRGSRGATDGRGGQAGVDPQSARAQMGRDTRPAGSTVAGKLGADAGPAGSTAEADAGAAAVGKRRAARAAGIDARRAALLARGAFGQDAGTAGERARGLAAAGGALVADSARQLRAEQRTAPRTGRRFGALTGTGVAVATVASGGAVLAVPLAAAAYLGGRSTWNVARGVVGSRPLAAVNPVASQRRQARVERAQEWSAWTAATEPARPVAAEAAPVEAEPAPVVSQLPPPPAVQPTVTTRPGRPAAPQPAPAPVAPPARERGRTIDPVRGRDGRR